MAGYLFACPHCSARLEAKDATRAGRVITCPQCNQQLTIPAPPPMGVVLSAPGGSAVAPPTPPESPIQVNQDPGFKRGMSPAKAYSDGPSTPAASGSGFDKLTPSGPLEIEPQHTIEASDEIEGYSYSLPEEGEAPKPRKLKKKKSADAEPEVEPVHPLEDPKYQLLGLVVLVGLIVGAITWYKSGDVKKKADEEAAIAAAKARNEAPPPPPAAPGMLPGATAAGEAPPTPAPANQPVAPTATPGTLPGGGSEPPPTGPPGGTDQPAESTGGLPGASPSTQPLPQ